MKFSSIARIALGSSSLPKRAWKMAGEASAQCGKSRAAIMADMVHCARVYGAGPTDYMMFRFWETTEAERATFFSRVSSAAFVKRVNDRAYSPIFNDKNAFSVKFRKYMGRETFDLFTGTEEAFARFLEGKDAVIAKPIDGDCGRGVEKLYLKDFGSSARSLWAYLKREDKPFGIVEEVLTQHEKMAALHPQSINCVRVATFVKDDGVPTVIYAACKAGTGDVACDNTGRGGITCRLDIDTGRIISNGHSEEMDEYVEHPDSHITFKGYEIPMADKVKALALECATVYPGFRYVGWDICVTPDGPVIVEGNDYPGYDLAQMPDKDTPHPWEGLIPCFTRQGIDVRG